METLRVAINPHDNKEFELVALLSAFLLAYLYASLLPSHSVAETATCLPTATLSLHLS